MIFDEEKAKELITAFGLNDNTLLTWRRRGKIPDRYFSTTPTAFAKRKQELTPKDLAYVEKIHAIMGTKKIIQSEFCVSCGYNPYLYNSIKTGAKNFNSVTLLAFRKQIEKIKITVTEIINNIPNPSFFTLVERLPISLTGILGEDLQRKIYYSKTKKEAIPGNLQDAVRQAFMIFRIELSQE